MWHDWSPFFTWCSHQQTTFRGSSQSWVTRNFLIKGFTPKTLKPTQCIKKLNLIETKLLMSSSTTSKLINAN